MSEQPPRTTTHWNSLEIAKLVVGALTPITLAIIGFQFSRADKARSEQIARFERVTEQRSRLWQSLGPNLNDIYAYLLYVGHWKSLNAGSVVAAKREADKVFHANRPYFSKRFADAYLKFMDASFQTFNAMGQDAKPRTVAAFRADENAQAVSGSENADEVHRTYYALLDAVAVEFDLHVEEPKRRQTPSEAGGQ